MAFALGNAVLPFYVIYKAISLDIFKSPTKFIIAFIIAWLFVLAACWIGVQIWWNRKDKVQQTSQEGAEFPATPVIAHLVQTVGEWLGAFIAIVGFGISLCAVIFFGNEAKELSYILGDFLKFVRFNALGIVLNPIIGFLIIVGFRYFAELLRALAAIANNTK
jgi:hypothetical protein